MNRIIITDEIIADARQYGRTITDVLAEKYQGEIHDRVSKDSRLSGFDAYQFALMDAGIGKNAIVDQMIKTDGGEWLFPTFVDRRLRESAAGFDILPYLVGATQMVAGNSVLIGKLDMDEENKDGVERKRVAEGSDIPLAYITLGDSAIRLFKRGRAVQASYEAIRNMSVDIFGKMIDMIANDVAGQQVGDAINTLVNGDGNGNPAPAITSVGTDIAYDDLVALSMAFIDQTGLPLTTLVANKKLYTMLLKTTFKTDETHGIMPGASFRFPQAQLDEVTVLYDPRVPNTTKTGSKEQIIGLNKDFALAKYIESGSQIREYGKFIHNQTELGTVTENAGFAKLNDKATILLQEK